MTERSFARWLRTGVSSIVEHALFSITNLLAGVWVARDLGHDAYGVYAITTGVVLLVSAVHHALVAEPMVVLASGRFADRGPAYLRAIAAAHVTAWPIVTLGLGAAGGVAELAGARVVAEALLGLAASLAPTLLMTALRRAASAELRAGRAAVGAAVYLASTAGGLYALHRAELITIFSTLAASGTAALVAAGVYALARPPASGPRVALREIAREHWRYGRAGIGAGLLAWVPHNLFYFILPAVTADGLAASASLRAAMNLVSPTFQINGALGIVLIPILGRRHRESPLRARQLVPFLGAFLAIDLAYWLIIVLAKVPIIELAYHGEYRATLAVLDWLAFVPVVTGISTVIRAWAFALDYPEAQLWASCAGAAGAASAIPVLAASPLAASAYGMLAAAGAYAVSVAYLVHRRGVTAAGGSLPRS